jgi:hypothetical protein
MIRMKRVDRRAIHLLFPMAAVTPLLEAFRAALAGEPRPIPIEFDRGVVKRKRFDTFVPRALVIEAAEDGRIVEDGETVFLRLDQDDLAYGADRLAACGRDGVFSPAELCKLQPGDRPESSDLYCMLAGE